VGDLTGFKLANAKQVATIESCLHLYLTQKKRPEAASLRRL
jgi:hypothetical protein